MCGEWRQRCIFTVEYICFKIILVHLVSVITFRRIFAIVVVVSFVKNVSCIQINILYLKKSFLFASALL